VAAALLTVEAICLRAVAATSAGGLWRDEANTVGLATLPTIHNIWENLQFDSFPIVWILIVRKFSELAGPMNDPAFRIFGFCIGIGVLAALWFYARSLRYSVPLLSIALFGMSPPVIVWGDSLRAYGLGILVAIIFGALLWRFVERPTSKRFASVALLGILSVHILYYNAILLAAFGVGAAVLAATKREWKTVGLVGLIGFSAAVSLLPYAETITKRESWSVLFRIPRYSFHRFLGSVGLTLNEAGLWNWFLWTELIVFGLAAALLTIAYPNRFGRSRTQRDIATFSVVTMLVGVTGTFVFLKSLSYLTQPWYYLSLLALIAVCLDSIFGVFIDRPLARIARLCAALVLGILTFVPALRASTTRMTNMDVISSRTQSIASRNDLIVVTPWYMGVAWNRYYRGATPWMTVPPIEFHRWHRADLVQAKLMEADQSAPIRPLETEIASVLRTGHRVFVVGNLPSVPLGKPPLIVPNVPLQDSRWRPALYEYAWGLEVAYFIQKHSTRRDVLDVRPKLKVSSYENVPLVVIAGWKP
jgi:hypothetical protein